MSSMQSILLIVAVHLKYDFSINDNKVKFSRKIVEAND